MSSPLRGAGSPRPSAAENAVQSAELVARAQAGSKQAFGELVRRYRPRILALALHLCGSESEAEDIAQEVFFKAYRKLDAFEGRSEFFTWTRAWRAPSRSMQGAIPPALPSCASSTRSWSPRSTGCRPRCGPRWSWSRCRG